MGEGADRARDGAGSDLLAGGQHPLLGTGELGIGDGELQSERGRLGMHAVAPADGERVLVLEGPGFQRGEQTVEIGDEDIGRLDQLDVEAGVEHVGGGQPRMEETRLGPHMLGDRGEEGDHVVLHFALDLVDAGDVEAAALPDRVRRMLGDLAKLGHRLGGIGLNPEPDAEFRLRLPEVSHFGAAVAWDHAGGKASSRRNLRMRG
jgi:hypothetical protein